jgi:hypothetical protein
MVSEIGRPTQFRVQRDCSWVSRVLAFCWGQEAHPLLLLNLSASWKVKVRSNQERKLGKSRAQAATDIFWDSGTPETKQKSLKNISLLLRFLASRPVRLAYQPPATPANGTFLSEQTSHQQSASSTFLSEQISINHQLNEQAASWPMGTW